MFSSSSVSHPYSIAPTRKKVIALANAFIRFGFASRGILYLLLSILTLLSLWRDSRRGPDEAGEALQVVSLTTPGAALLFCLGLGFLGFAFGMCWAALNDSHSEGDRPQGLARRAGHFGIGLGHVALAAAVFWVISGQHAASDNTRRWENWILRSNIGRTGLMTSGLWAAGFAVFLVWQSLTGRLDPYLDLRSISPAATRGAEWAGRLGVLARALVYGTIGFYLVRAGWYGDVSKVVGMGGALRRIGHTRLGPGLLALTAGGLAAYGAFLLVQARFRRIGRRVHKGNG